MPITEEVPKIATVLYSADERNAVQTWTARSERQSLTVSLASLNAADCIAASLDALASRALQIWPHWHEERSIEPAWLKKAERLAAEGKAPLLPGLVGEIQIRQLALAVTENVVSVTLAVQPELPDAGDCKGFPYAVEWIARESGLNVIVLLPRIMAANENMSALLYHVTNWAADSQGSGAFACAPVSPLKSEAAPLLSSPRIPDETAPEAERIIGSPHPRSKGEQLLTERLERDPQLAGLFGYNQPLKTRCGHKFIVDLLWQAGKVVVEVDGYYFHSNSVVFASDRDRDYRLLLSGYRVLRLPHDEVVRDVDLTVEKIRDVVNFVRNQEAR